MDTIESAQKNWDALGKKDPLFVILSYKEKEGGKWDTEEFFETGKAEIDAVLTRAHGYAPTLGHMRALDFGCGAGRLTLALARSFEHVDGVDIAPSMIELARSHNTEGERVQYHVNATSNLALFADKSFDCIYTNITLQHIKPEFTREYLREFVRTLKKGGLLIFQLPTTPKKESPKNEQTVRSFLKKLLPQSVLSFYRTIRYKNPPHVDMYGIPETEVEALIKKAGGTIVASEPDQNAMGWNGMRYWVTR